MEGLVREFVRRREALRQAGGGLRVPESLRQVAVEFGRWALEQGESLGGAAAQLEVSRATLERWLEDRAVAEASPVREVVVRKVAGAGTLSAAGGLTLVTPEGFRIGGLGASELAELVRALR